MPNVENSINIFIEDQSNAITVDYKVNFHLFVIRFLLKEKIFAYIIPPI